MIKTLRLQRIILSFFVLASFSLLCCANKFSDQLPKDIVTLKTSTDICALVASVLPDNPLILEAGACNGGDSVAMAKFWPQGLIHSFEPVPELFMKVAQKAKDYRNISIYQTALSDKDGSADFYVSSFKRSPDDPSASSSLLKPAKHLNIWPNIIFKKKISVETTTIDNWAEKNSIDHVDFIWLDTQGSELSILKAAPHIVKTVKAISAEVEFIEAYKDQPLFKDVKKWLENNGFTLVAVRMYSCAADALFIRADLIKT